MNRPQRRGANAAHWIALASRHFRAVGAGWTTFPTIFVVLLFCCFVPAIFLFVPPVDSSD
jgi:hypothetical protein